MHHICQDRGFRFLLIEVWLLVVFVSTFASCGLFFPKTPPPPRNKTQTLLLKCDKRINQNMLLPVDIIYVTEGDDLKAVLKVGPNKWFYAEERDSWPHRQSLELRSGEDVLVTLKKPPDVVSVVIFVNYYQVEDQKAQQVILSTDAATEEVIWVAKSTLYH
jgi:hypothetical protein